MEDLLISVATQVLHLAWVSLNCPSSLLNTNSIQLLLPA